MTLGQFISVYGGDRKIRAPKEGEKIQRGFTMQSLEQVARVLPHDFEEIDQARDRNFRACWGSLPDRTIVTFCEGDVDIQTFENGKLYLEEYRRIVAYYNELAS